MVNSNDAQFDPWNDEPTEEIVTEGVRRQQAGASNTWMSEWERAELKLHDNTAPATEAKAPSPANLAWVAICGNLPMAKALAQPNVNAPPPAPPPPW